MNKLILLLLVSTPFLSTVSFGSNMAPVRVSTCAQEISKAQARVTRAKQNRDRIEADIRKQDEEMDRLINEECYNSEFSIEEQLECLDELHKRKRVREYLYEELRTAKNLVSKAEKSLARIQRLCN